MKRSSFRRPLLALVLIAMFLGQVTWALAGTTGGVAGQVTDEAGAPIAGAAVRAVSASQSASATTDGAGRFNFLSLAPDTYTVSIEKDGYNPVSYAGVTVFADNQLTLSFKMAKALKTIAKVSATSAGNLVKAGVGSDIYSVNAQAITTSAVNGGGGNLNSAYSAISTVPGVNVPVGGAGWNQNTYVRGSQSFFTGFEYDGIPVNRAFDNYNSSTESNLGLQELQVYTGGGPSSSASAGTSGFINQVFKTGTYPGYLDLSGGIGTPTYYHQAKVEAGGATPDRRFSYYVGLSGYNQGFRVLDNANGGDLTNNPLSVYTGQGIGARGSYLINGIPSLADECTPGTNLDPNPLWGGGTPPAAGPWTYFQADLATMPNCNIPYNGIYANLAQIADRESVANFHFRIPQKNGTSDDIQLLGSSSMLNSQYYTSANDVGGLAPYTLSVTGQPYVAPAPGSPDTCSGAGTSCYPSYMDALVYNAPFGTPVAGLKATPYYQPSSPLNRQAGAQVDPNNRDGIMNDTGIVKLQYTHQFSSNAFARIFGYTFFSDWTQAGANSSFNCYTWGNGPNDCGVAANYDLITHTGGGQLELVDQITSQHLLQLTANYTTANVVRFNNTGFVSDNCMFSASCGHGFPLGPNGGWFASSSPVGLISQSNGIFTCYSKTTGNPVPCSSSSYQTTAGAVTLHGVPPIPASAAAAGAQWVTLWNGNSRGSFNTVKPQFSFISLSDQWRPSDRWLFNAQLRYEDYKYGLVANPGMATNFYAQVVSNDVCVNASGQPLSVSLLPGQAPPAPVIYTPTCAAGTQLPAADNYPAGIPAGYSHPAFSANSPGTYDIKDLSPRLSATFTVSPDTVLRGSIGRFTEPPISASVQYLNNSGNNLSVWNATLPLGFNSPFHPIPAMSATQADLSLEHHIRGTDMSFKLTPFYNYTTGYQEQSFIGPNFVTQAPVGNFKSMGAEFAFTKGDFAKDGLSTQIAATYTHAQVQYTNWFGSNQLNAVNQAIQQYNLLTKGGGGSPYYCSGGADAAGNASPGVATPGACSALATPGTPITNPYYNNSPQGTLDVNGWYAPGNEGLSPTSNPSTTYYDAPWNFTWLLNWRKQKFAATFSLQATQGSAYGGPLDVIGIDPRTCGANSSQSTRPNPFYDPTAPVSASNPLTVPVTPITSLSPGTDPFQCDALAAAGTLSNAAGHLFIPNPQTGTFASPGAFRNPWIAVGNLALTYDFSPRISGNVTVANLFHTCWGGTKAPWTSAFPPGQNVCGYFPASSYISNFYNGTSPTDSAANGVSGPTPWQMNSYGPGTYSYAGSIPSPLNVFFGLTVKM